MPSKETPSGSCEKKVGGGGEWTALREALESRIKARAEELQHWLAERTKEETAEGYKEYCNGIIRELRAGQHELEWALAALAAPAPKPAPPAPNELDLVRLVLSAHQTAYAKFHCDERRGVIESDTMAIGYASVELAKALKGTT